MTQTTPGASITKGSFRKQGETDELGEEEESREGLLTHGGNRDERGDAGAVVAEGGHTAVVGSGRGQAGNGHNMWRDSDRLL